MNLSNYGIEGERESVWFVDNGFVIGVSAGSLIFVNNLMDNLGLLYTAAMLVRNIPDDVEIIDD